MQKNILIFLIGTFSLFFCFCMSSCGFKNEAPVVVEATAPAPEIKVSSPKIDDTNPTAALKIENPFVIYINDVKVEFIKNQNGIYESKILISAIKSISIEPQDEQYLKYQISLKLHSSDEDLVKVYDEEVLENPKQKFLIKLPDQNDLKNIKLLGINFERIFKDKDNTKFTIYLEDTNND